MDTDIQALEDAKKALSRCTSRRMLFAAFDYLRDYFVEHPPEDLPDCLLPENTFDTPTEGARPSADC